MLLGQCFFACKLTPHHNRAEQASDRVVQAARHSPRRKHRIAQSCRREKWWRHRYFRRQKEEKHRVEPAAIAKWCLFVYYGAKKEISRFALQYNRLPYHFHFNIHSLTELYLYVRHNKPYHTIPYHTIPLDIATRKRQAWVRASWFEEENFDFD